MKKKTQNSIRYFFDGEIMAYYNKYIKAIDVILNVNLDKVYRVQYTPYIIWPFTYMFWYKFTSGP